VADEVIVVIIDAIRGGLYEPGDKLPRERDLAAQLEVSRATIREAVGVLERAGIVSVRRGNAGGIVVETRSVSPSVAAARHGESYLNIQSLLEVRRALELPAALLAIERMSTADVDELARLVDKLPSLLTEPEEFLAVDSQFHLRIGHMSGNPVLRDYVESMWNSLLLTRAHYPVGHVDLERALQNQSETLRAMQTRDATQVSHALDIHLAASEEHFLGQRLSYPTARS
jgi:DNA-binding FadR family transcriptional regulator